MATINEDYVSFETAKLLKEKGFNEPIQYFYKFDSKELYRGTVFTNTQVGDKFYNAPTLQMTMKWLREVHNLFIEMHIQNDGSYIGYIYNTNGFGLIGWDKRRVSSSYEQACEAAIKYCLEHLICKKPAEEYNITGIGSKKAQGKLGKMIKNIKSGNNALKDK